MVEIDQLYKIGDILNGEGMFLGLFKHKNGTLYLSSHLKDGSGDLFYSTDSEIFTKYLKSEIKLKELYLESEDFIVTRKFRNEFTSFIQKDMVELILLGDNFYSEFSDSMKNERIEKKFNIR